MKNKELNDKLIAEGRKESEDVPCAAIHFDEGIDSIDDNCFKV